MSPETLMRAYTRLTQYMTQWNVDPAFARAMGVPEYERWARIARKVHSRILKYASAGHAARTRYLHTRGYMKTNWVKEYKARWTK